MRALGVVVCAISLAACASGRQAQDTDASTSVGDAEPDGPPTHGFGEPCADNKQCDSGLCILVGTSGQCTKLCGDCPAGYGCLGVEGIAIEGQVSFVCVPTSNQLCTTCTQDSECTLIGMDRCVTYPDGDRACARDCTSVTCPIGYACQTVDIGGTDYKQCMATSGACDCTAANPGGMQPCNIFTPWNVCIGSQTCAGASGWGTCAPPSATDDPDGTYTDDNCDGIDGDISKGIFVAGGGANNATCGLTYMTPCQTISYGIVRAVQAGKQHVFVQAGTYNEVVVLLNGINVWGGYDFNWQRDAYSDVAHRVRITGGQDNSAGGDGEWLAVRAHDLIVPVTIGDVIIRGPTAVGAAGGSGIDGKSSYAVHVRAASVTLTRVQIEGGNGANGGNGGNGADAVIVDAQSYMVGGGGGNGDQYATACNNSSRGGGGPQGTNFCSSSPSALAMDGGLGGAGGTMDTDCSCCSYNFNARAGASGGYAAYAPGLNGYPGSGGSGTTSCGPTTSGYPGLAQNGAAGWVIAGGYLSGSYWYGQSGGTGGGGGGAGGCAARGGGSGGGGGGGSFGVFASGASTVTITGCNLIRGIGGNGGTGGAGGRGQSGGSGGIGGTYHPGSATPGNGGDGAHGGHGGGGAGGQGGRSIGLVWTSGSTVTDDCTQSGGAAGSGGSGGPSAPSAPLGERDGNDGPSGQNGTVENTRICAGSC